MTVQSAQDGIVNKFRFFLEHGYEKWFESCSITYV